MKMHRSALFFVGITLLLSLACRLPGLILPAATGEPDITHVQPTDEVSPTDLPSPTLEPAAPEPTPTDTIPPETIPTETEQPPQPTLSPASLGQIAYTDNGNIYRYIIDTNQVLQVTTDGDLGDYMNIYGWSRFSSNGRYLAYNRGNASYIYDMVADNLTDISAYGQFFAWRGVGTQFYAVQGDFECPDFDDMDDQVLINFDILSMVFSDLPNAEVLAKISGGLRFMRALSQNGDYASIISCGCYSECGSEELIYLPTMDTIAPPITMAAGYIDFSPDDTQLTVSQWQMFDYIESPLYVANSDYSGMVAIFSQPSVAPVDANWSPGGEWIAFTAVTFAADAFTETERCVHLASPDGHLTQTLTCEFSTFITWSPDGTHLLYSQENGDHEQFFIYNLAAGNSTPIPIQVDPYLWRSVDWGQLP